jgi:signal transduction histidine kinase
MTRLALEKQQLSRRLLTAEYDARQAIVADLHDGAQKELCALLATLAQTQHADEPTRQVLIDQACSRASDALRDLRDLAHGVYPHTLSHAGLGPAVEEAADHLDLMMRMRIPAERLPGTVERTAYFFICEALTNIAKYAAADTTEIIVDRSEGTVTVSVRDDGVGGADAYGRGLVQMRDRVEAHSGTLTVDSPPGIGTRLTMRMPCV